MSVHDRVPTTYLTGFNLSFDICSKERIPNDDIIITGFLADHDHHAMIQPFDAKSNSLTIPYFKNRIYTYLVLNVYAKYKNSDEGAWETMHMVGSSCTPLYELFSQQKATTRQFKSEFSKSVGDFTISFSFPINFPDYFSKDVLDSEVNNALKAVVAFRKAHEANLENIGKFADEFKLGDICSPPLFTSIKYREHNIPVPIILASLENMKMKQNDMEKTMKWWLELAKSNCSVNDITNIKDKYVLGEIIGELFTMSMKGMIYAHDKRFTRKVENEEEEDQWMSILSFPSLENASFDCEDGTITVLEMVNAFKKATFFDKELKQIQEYLKNYAICATLGLLKVSETEASKEYVFHAYPMFLDVKWFEGGKIDYPAIVMETTNYMAATFNKQVNEEEIKIFEQADDMITTAAKHWFKKPIQVSSFPLKQVTKVSEQETKLRFVLHTKAPSSAVKAAGVYGKIHSIYKGESQDDCKMSVYYPMNKNEIGVDAFEIFEGNNTDFSLKHCIDVTKQHLNDMDILLQANTPITLPLVSNSTSIPLKETTMNRYLLKDIDKSLENSLLETFNIKEMKQYDLFKNCNMFIIDVAK